MKYIFPLTPLIGSSLMLLGVLRFFDLVQIETKFLICYSLAAFLFTWADLLPHISDSDDNETSIGLKRGLRRGVDYIRLQLLYFSAVVSIIVLPFLELDGLNKLLTDKAFNDSIILWSLGMVITIVGFREYQFFKERLNQIDIEHNSLENELRAISSELKQLQSDYKAIRVETAMDNERSEQSKNDINF